MVLCESGTADAVNRVASRATVNQKDRQGRNALFYALDNCSGAKLQVLSVLFLKGAQWRCKDESGVG